MKAKELLRRYADGRRDFRGENLRGQSFKGQDLSGADFSLADIRGANFTNATLTGAKFVGAKAGLQRRWAISLLLGSCFFSAVSVVLSIWLGALGFGFITYQFNSSPVHIYFVLVMLVIFWIITIRKGILAGVEFLTIAFILVISSSIIFIFLTTGNWVEAIDVALVLMGSATGVFTIPFIFLGSFPFAEAFTVAGFIAVAGAVVFTVAIMLARPIPVYFAIAFVTPVELSRNGFLALFAWSLTFALIIFNLYLSWRAMKGDPRDAWIRSAAIAFAAIGGTSFRGANLTDADFTNATLKSTDFRKANRKANLTRTLWKDAIKLDQVRPGETYLRQPKVRELVRTGEGENVNYDRLNLEGVNLQGAHLQNASFIETNLNNVNLQGADLTDAQLFHIQLDGADLTEATLTGIFFKDYLITHKTKLNNIQCDYVYLEPGKQERRPETGDFEPGDFAALFAKEAFDTVDLIFQDGIDWKAFYESFIEVTNENNQVISIRALEKKENGAFVIRLNVPDAADKLKIEKSFKKKYNRKLKQLEERYQEKLQAKDGQIVIYQEHNKNLMGILKSLADKDTHVQNQYINNPQGDVTMTNDSRSYSISGNNNRAVQGDNNVAALGDNAQAVEGDNNQLSQGAPVEETETVTKDDALKLMADLEKLIKGSDLPDDTKQEVIDYLQATKRAVDKPEPKKELALGNFEEMTETLKNATETVVASKTLWATAKPIILKLAGWLGAAATGSFLIGL